MKISASLHAADPLRLAHAVEQVTPFVASIHVDVMDGAFAPAFGFGESLVAELVANGCAVDVHLMVERPERWAKRFAALGARRVAFHLEAATDVLGVAYEVRSSGALAYLALQPQTHVSRALPLVAGVDGALLLTAPAGGGAFDHAALARVMDLPTGFPTIVDGRLEPKHLPLLKAWGVELAVVGTALFSTDDHAARAQALQCLAAD